MKLNRIRVLLVIAVLVGQTALLAHAWDFDLHASGDRCEICLQAAGAAPAGLPAAVAEALPLFDYLLPEQAFPTLFSFFPHHRAARAPPAGYPC